VKYAWIEEHRDRFQVTRMCSQLGVSRTGYCQWRTRAPSDRTMANAVLDAQVAALHAQSKRSYGRPRIVRGLLEQGVRVSHERVRNSLKRQHLRPVYKRPYRMTTGFGPSPTGCSQRARPARRWLASQPSLGR
jgi:putative transposase